MVEMLRQELEKTKAALHISNGKLKLKVEVAAAAMAAQAAAERSLQLADSRAAGLLERIEELTKQLQKEEMRDCSNRHRTTGFNTTRRFFLDAVQISPFQRAMKCESLLTSRTLFPKHCVPCRTVG